MTEKLYTKSEVYALALPSTYLQPLNLPLDTDVPALMKLYAKLKAMQLPSAQPSALSLDEDEYYKLANIKLFDGEPLPSGTKPVPSDDDPLPSAN
jgi:hypothetical protein